MSKEEWKNTGKELGGAFQGLAKSLIRTAKQGVDAAEEWAERDENEPQQQETGEQESTVFNDGTWRETGKNIGHAFAGLGKTILKAGEEAADRIDNDEQ